MIESLRPAPDAAVAEASLEFPDVLATIGRLLNDRGLAVELGAEPGL